MSLIAVLTQGKEVTRQLMKNLHSSSHEKCVLLETILVCYAKALSMLNKVDAEDYSPNVTAKKRKTSSSGREQVTVPEGLDDGYHWRKYGQKEILGAKFRRGYYRCTHRKQGCLARKQVQKSDADPTLVEVTYQGSHTCHLNMRTPSTAKVGLRQNEKHRQKPLMEEAKIEQDGVSVTLLEGHKVETEDLTSRENCEFPCFDFPSTANEEDKLFHGTTLGGDFMGCFSPEFMSPSSSAFSGFTLSPFSADDNGIGQSLPIASMSCITEIVSNPTSVNNSPIFQSDFTQNKFDSDISFPFNSQNFSADCAAKK